MLVNIILFIILVVILDIAYGKLYDKLAILIDFLRFGPRVKMIDDGEVIYLNGPKKRRKPLMSAKTKKYLKYFACLLIILLLTLGCLAIFVHMFMLAVKAIAALSLI